MLIASVTSSSNAPRKERSLGRFGATPNSRTHASVALPPVYHVPRCDGMSRGNSLAAVHGVVELAVVEIVMLAVPALAPVMLTGEVEPKANVGGLMAPVGLDVTATVSTTLPVNPLLGVMVTVEALPVVAPAPTDTAEPATVNAGFTPTGFTVTTDLFGNSVVGGGNGNRCGGRYRSSSCGEGKGCLPDGERLARRQRECGGVAGAERHRCTTRECRGTEREGDACEAAGVYRCGRNANACKRRCPLDTGEKRTNIERTEASHFVEAGLQLIAGLRSASTEKGNAVVAQAGCAQAAIA